MFNPQVFFEAGRARSGVAYFPVMNMSYVQIQVSTRNGNAVLNKGDGSAETNVILAKYMDFTVSNYSQVNVEYLSPFTGNFSLKFLLGLTDVYSLKLSQSWANRFNILSIEDFFKQFPNLYSLYLLDYNYGTPVGIFKGDLAKLPDSVEKVLINDFEVVNSATDLIVNFSSYKPSSKLKYFRFGDFNESATTNIKITGDLGKVPNNVSHLYFLRCGSTSSITYTAGKIWASAFDTLSIPLALGNFLELDALYTDMANSITSATGGKVISMGGWFSGTTQVNYLKSLGFTFGGLDTSTGTASSTTQKFIGDITEIPSDVTFFKIAQCAAGSVITYTSGKVWASAFDTLSIPLPLSHTELDSLLADMDGSINTKIGAGVITIGGYRSAVSDAHVASLQAKGFTVNIQRVLNDVSNADSALLRLDFQNNFDVYSNSGINIIAGGTSNQPTFALSGRKAGEYCAVFNGSQSIKTTNNLPINSDKVTIAFWTKTNTTRGVITELSSNFDTNNSFSIEANKGGTNINAASHTSSYNELRVAVAQGSWSHYVAVIDRASTLKLYRDGALIGTFTSTHVGNFVNNILFIGQRGGSSFGFNGSLTRLKIYNYAFTPSDVSNLYNSEL